MPDKLKCPLMSGLAPLPSSRVVPGVVGRSIPGPVQLQFIMGECQGEGCAWWARGLGEGRCAILALAKEE